MSRSYSAGPRRQRGDVLMESLIGLVLMSVIGLGVTYATSRTLVSQRDMNVQSLAVIQMRSLLQQYGSSLCATNSAKAVLNLPSLDTKPIALKASCSGLPTNITIQGKPLEPTSEQAEQLKSVALSTLDQKDQLALFGGIIKVGDQI